MRLKTRFPSPDSLSCAEIFETEAFRNGSLEYRQELMRKSSQWRYECEVQADALAARLPCGPERYLRDRVVLDLGCFTGGRSARWAEVHGIRELHGLDVDDVFVSAAQAFARARNLNAHYVKGFGESLPYEDVKFDTIVSLDVLEHVRDYGAVLAECWRTLKPGGHFIAVFPPYYSPCDHHLSQASAVPCLTWLFSGRTLTRAYNRILDERGPAARWYSRRSRDLAAGRGRTCSTASPWVAFVARCAGTRGPSSCGSTFRSLTDARGCGCQCAGYSGPSPTSRLCASYSRPAGRTSCVRPEQSRCRAARFLGALQTELSMRRSLAARGSTGSAPRRDRLRRAAACGRAPRAGWPRRAKRSAGIAAGHDTGA